MIETLQLSDLGALMQLMTGAFGKLYSSIFQLFICWGSYAVDAQHPTVFLYFSTLVADTEIT